MRSRFQNRSAHEAQTADAFLRIPFGYLTLRMESFTRRLGTARDFSYPCEKEGIIKTEKIRIL